MPYHESYLKLLLSIFMLGRNMIYRNETVHKPLMKLHDVFKSSILHGYYLIIITVGKTGIRLALQEILMELI